MYKTKHLPVMISLSAVTETTAVLLIPDAGNADASGNCQSLILGPAGPLNMRINVPPAELAKAFP